MNFSDVSVEVCFVAAGEAALITIESDILVSRQLVSLQLTWLGGSVAAVLTGPALSVFPLRVQRQSLLRAAGKTADFTLQGDAQVLPVNVLLQTLLTFTRIIAVITVVTGLRNHGLHFGVSPVKVLPDTVFVKGAKLTLITVELFHFNLMFGGLVDSQLLPSCADIVAKITGLSQMVRNPFVNSHLVSSHRLSILRYKMALRAGKPLGIQFLPVTFLCVFL